MDIEKYMYTAYRCVPYLIYLPDCEPEKEKIITKLRLLFRCLQLGDEDAYDSIREQLDHFLELGFGFYGEDDHDARQMISFLEGGE